ncbi:NAD(P)H-hydrate dehydratase [Acidocella aminolytica]|uniref:Bifunctional NAD(P)H-hydrate repair enzyme n=1 Tax=Acidocella aminolytica 101 = DSM 11237 TaxID=1120923 RepID=A0A0D6PAE3_9PROT|nr:NAD(P)H-hydrate dehydratase [Acidocella aminolytica]GAN78720.1 sugar kinase [Acidocella aminolytica 101 = DSM 11237]GBQ38672.1 sugar kinase [Acidocella aminolytica 101 = DSM 11237]SHE78433.1 yjeF C-terminal region, hydroxyethylthiazole kinase-related [Acidocella aminolytica 101 = DSM 11237]
MAYSFERPESFTGALLTPVQMAQADALAGDTARLMEAAGRAIARSIMRRCKKVPVLVLAGPGNNGGDGRVAARYLAWEGWPVRVRDFRTADPAEVARAGLVVDAIFGAGLSRDLDEHTISLLRAAKNLVAVDVPSGLDGASGQVRGFAPQAAFTVTFVRKKPGHLLFPGRALCGEVLLRDIGMPVSIIGRVGPDIWENSPSLFTLPPRDTGGHKYTSGEVTILSGTLPGAARLAAMAARRAGAGMVSLAAADASPLPEAGIILRHDPLDRLLEDPRRLHWVVGPGLGVAAAGVALARLLQTPGLAILADADALTACAGTPKKLRGVCVITPHEGEFTRLFGTIGPDKIAAARRAAALTGAVTVLKGPDTVIAAPEGTAVINANAPPWLATGGTGDVLSGLIAALLTRGMAPFPAACAGVWLHGAAAQEAGPGMLAEDLPSILGHITQG